MFIAVCAVVSRVLIVLCFCVCCSRFDVVVRCVLFVVRCLCLVVRCCFAVFCFCLMLVARCLVFVVRLVRIAHGFGFLVRCLARFA